MKGLIYSAQNSTAVIYVMLTALIVIFACILFLLLRLKKCPQGKLMIVIGKFHDGAKCRIVRYGDVKFVIPFIQSCQYLSLEPIKTEVSIEFNERQELFLKETGIEIPTEFTVAVSEESENVMKNAAEKLIGLSDKEIRKIAEDIISGRLKDFFADFVYLNALSKRKDLYFQLAEFIEAELGKAGLKLAGMSNGGAV